MTIKQTKESFAAAEARRPSPERLMQALNMQAERFKAYPEEAREFMVGAGVLTRSGCLTKPYRMLNKRDREGAARTEARE